MNNQKGVLEIDKTEGTMELRAPYQQSRKEVLIIGYYSSFY